MSDPNRQRDIAERLRQDAENLATDGYVVTAMLMHVAADRLAAQQRELDALRAIVEPLRELDAKAFCAPWTYSTWEIECETCDASGSTEDGDCPEPDCDGTHVPCTTIESLEEYPSPPGQVVAQFRVPGLLSLADRNGALIVALRNALPELLRLLPAPPQPRSEGGEDDQSDERAVGQVVLLRRDVEVGGR